jgi:UDP-N-acetylmuramoyl-L-alanyl-D-glutamate--2,6-diaminopimelate ligase
MTCTVRDLLHSWPKDLYRPFSHAGLSERDGDLIITSLTADSREVRPGTAFFAIKGTAQDGHDFIGAAQQAGAVVVVGERLAGSSTDVPYLHVRDSRLALALAAGGFYGQPSHAMTMGGVTGTSGKTTTTYLCESILKASGQRVGVIGTVNFRFGDTVYPSTHTTPGAVELQALLARMQQDGCTAVVMEVSSHALKQHRCAGMAFDAMVFSNLSPEHLDFHPDLEDYFQSKAMLFREYVDVAVAAGKRPALAINIDDAYGKRLYEEIRAAGRSDCCLLAFGMGPGADVSGRHLACSLSGIRGTVEAVEVASPLLGRFNGANILAAIAVGQGLGINPAAIAQGIRELTAVPGRLQPVPGARGVHVLVDYAHKPDALEKVLNTLVEMKGTQRLITVFGCGGDRDRLKRPVMGRIAVQRSDYVFVTSDNPRTEKPEAIIQEILVGTAGHANLTVEPDRKKAIFAAIRLAQPGDVVVIAGKGHEDYQILPDPQQPGKTVKIHFDDREVAAEALQAR